AAGREPAPAPARVRAPRHACTGAATRTRRILPPALEISDEHSEHAAVPPRPAPAALADGRAGAGRLPAGRTARAVPARQWRTRGDDAGALLGRVDDRRAGLVAAGTAGARRRAADHAAAAAVASLAVAAAAPGAVRVPGGDAATGTGDRLERRQGA